MGEEWGINEEGLGSFHRISGSKYHQSNTMLITPTRLSQRVPDLSWTYMFSMKAVTGICQLSIQYRLCPDRKPFVMLYMHDWIMQALLIG